MKNKKVIVTTTINEPTKATLEYCKKVDWDFIIVGDTKTPHESYTSLSKEYSQLIYLHPDEQELLYPELSQVLGWKTIQRRNIGFVHAYKLGYEIMATVDDDNIPYDNWGVDIKVHNIIETDIYTTENIVFDPLSPTKYSNLWHRGFPIQLLKYRNLIQYSGKDKIKVFIQANLWDGDPDIDAICRLSNSPMVKFDPDIKPYSSSCEFIPFNSQNTILSTLILKHYFMFPFIGRMDDIWGGYILQHFIGSGNIIFDKPTVYQERNTQDLIKNLNDEIFGYRNTLELLNNINNFESYLPIKSLEAFKIYQSYFN